MPKQIWHFRLQLIVAVFLLLAVACGGGPTQAPESASVKIAVQVRGDQLEVTPGTTCTFTAIVSGTSDMRVKWSVTAGTITSNGVYTPPEISTSTAVEVTATSYADPKANGKLSLTVSPRVAPSILYFRAVASSITAGAATTLEWHVHNANRIEISQMGRVNAEGSREIAPTATTDYTLTATGPGGITSATARVAVSPLLYSVNPNWGSVNGGDQVVLSGAGLQPGATVVFGGLAATEVAVVSSTEIDAVTPAHAAGVVDVTVTVPGAPSATLSGAFTFTYIAPSGSSDRYVSPSGSDSNTGLDATHTWKTIAYAGLHVPAGGTIHVAPGTYAPALMDCAAGATQGTATAPITLISDSERQAYILGDGTKDPLRLNNCNYWSVIGFRIEDGDHTGYTSGNLYLFQTDHVTLKRNLLRRPNRYWNAELIEVDHSSNTLVEENELYEFHAHGLIFYYGGTSGRNIARRNYANSREYADLAGGFVSVLDPARGDQCFLVYAESNALLENNIAEDCAYGFEVEPGGSALADNNKFYGNIGLSNVQSFHIEANSGAGTQTQDDAHMPHNTVFVNNVHADGYISTAGFSLESAKSTTLTNNTAITVSGHTGFQFIRHAENGGDGNYSAHIDRAIAMQTSGASGNGFYAYASSGTVFVTGDVVNAYNWTTPFTGMGSSTNQTTGDPGLGGCMVYRPNGSWAETNDVGAKVLYRYEGETLSSIPLWSDAGAFPGGAVIAGWNDVTYQSLLNLPARLHINTTSCPFPAGYGSGITTYPLTVSMSGSGSVTSTVPDGRIACSPNCSANFNSGTSITLQAQPVTGYVFSGWTSPQLACSGTNSVCSFTIGSSTAVSATFTVSGPPPPPSTYAIGNPPDYTWTPYHTASQTGTMFNTPLPGNCYDQTGASCSGGIMARSINDIRAKYVAGGGGRCNETQMTQGYVSGSCGFHAPIYPAGTSGAGNAGSDQAVPYYFSTVNDPWYWVQANGINVKFHAPQQALWTGGCYDQFMAVYDQAQGIGVQTYAYMGCGGTGRRLPVSNCPGTGSSSCAVKITDGGTYWTAARIGQDSDFYNRSTYTDPATGYTLGGGNSGSTGISAAPYATILRFKEMAAATAGNYATINHAMQLGFLCGYSAGGGSVSDSVFPNTGGLLACSESRFAGQGLNVSSAPVAGELYACDYTKAQIDGMSIDPLAKAILRAYCRYGGYFTQTGADMNYGFDLVDTGSFESLEPFAYANAAFPDVNAIATNNPHLAVSCGSAARGSCDVKGRNYNVELYWHMLNGIGRLVGPGGTDREGNSCSASPGCYFSGHFHVINSCVARALAGQTAAQGACY